MFSGINQRPRRKGEIFSLFVYPGALFSKNVSQVNITIYTLPLSVGHDVTGHGGGAGSVAHATELPPTGQVAARTREGTGETNEASPRLPAVAHDRSYSQLPNWNPAAIPQGIHEEILYFDDCVYVLIC